MHVDQIGFIKERISLDQLLVKAAFQVAKFLFKRGSILGTVNSNSKSLHEFSNATGIENNNKKGKKHNRDYNKSILSRYRFLATLLEPARNNQK